MKWKLACRVCTGLRELIGKGPEERWKVSEGERNSQMGNNQGRTSGYI